MSAWRDSRRLTKNRCAERQSPYAGSLRVSLRYESPPFLARKGARGMVERFFQYSATGCVSRTRNPVPMDRDG